MFELIKEAWNYLVYQPQLNLTYFFYKLTNDIGFSIILIAIVVNVPLWYLFAKSYINSQKTRLLLPQLKLVQKNHKEDPQAMMKAMREFNQKHNLSNSSIFWVLIFQLFFVSGLLYLVQNISNGLTFNQLYQPIFGIRDILFDKLAFNFFDIGTNASSSFKYSWILILGFFLSYFLGYYMLKLAPHVAPIEDPNATEEDKEKQIAMQKSQEFVAIYLSPILLTVLYWNTTFGLNLYFAMVNVLAIVRQVLISQYYKSHVDRLIVDILESDNVTKNEINLKEVKMIEGENFTNFEKPIDSTKVTKVANNKTKTVKKKKKK